MSSSSRVKVAAAQLGSILFDVPATLRKVEQTGRQAVRAGVRLVVFRGHADLLGVE